MILPGVLADYDRNNPLECNTFATTTRYPFFLQDSFTLSGELGGDNLSLGANKEGLALGGSIVGGGSVLRTLLISYNVDTGELALGAAIVGGGDLRAILVPHDVYEVGILALGAAIVGGGVMAVIVIPHDTYDTGTFTLSGEILNSGTNTLG